MKRNMYLTLAIGALIAMTGAAQADHTFPADPGPYPVVAGAPVTVNYNDAANAAGVPAPAPGDNYYEFTFTADWTAGGGNPWSSEADITLNFGAAGTTVVDPATFGSGLNGNPTTLTFIGSLVGYDPTVDATIDVIMNQSFAGSDATWSNLNLTIVSVTPPPPIPIETIVPDGSSTPVFHPLDSVSWFAVTHPGGDLTVTTDFSDFDTEVGVYDVLGDLLGNDDDGGVGTQSAVQLAALPAGTYYVAASGFNTVFGATFWSVTGGSAEGNLQVNAIRGLVPVELMSFSVE